MEKEKYVLFIDPYPWDFEITPSSILKAITWALDHGWSPAEGPTKNMAYSKEINDFIWLPGGVKYIHEM